MPSSHCQGQTRSADEGDTYLEGIGSGAVWLQGELERPPPSAQEK